MKLPDKQEMQEAQASRIEEKFFVGETHYGYLWIAGVRYLMRGGEYVEVALGKYVEQWHIACRCGRR